MTVFAWFAGLCSCLAPPGGDAEPEAAEAAGEGGGLAPSGTCAEAPGTAAAARAQTPAQEDGDSDDEGAHGGACRGAAGWLALSGLALLAIGGPAAAHLATARPCWSAGNISGREEWATFWPGYAVLAPASLATAAWTVAVRRRARPVPLHQWTLRFGACAAVHGAAYVGIPLLDAGCHGGAAGTAWQVACLMVASAAYSGTVVVPYHVLALKLGALGAGRLAWVSRAAAGAAAAAGVAVVMSWSALAALGHPGVDEGPVPLALNGVLVATLLVGLLGITVVAYSGVRGLLLAARSARGGPAEAARAARWVRWTAALVAASLLLSCVEAVFVSARGFTSYIGDWSHARTWATAINNVSNCLQVALLSGLAGTGSLRRVVLDAFESINTYTAEELQDRYEQFLLYLDDAQVKWIRCGFLRQIAARGCTMVRCQEVPPTEAEEDLFKTALSGMELLFSVSNVLVLVLPMDDYVERGKEYITRSWCFLELCLAVSFHNIANAAIHEQARKAVLRVKYLRGHTVEGFRAGLKRTRFTKKGDGGVVLELFERTVSKRVRRATRAPSPNRLLFLGSL
ncbi:unnamed protein product [Prorocentrum cordatum]|uniref:Uncharacterized protein n=1 Tax=Prorocentrum cordatum TaxID=2364126 RepID=A0ABN9WX57_9DINO|nr:unnamed protein product [Polarella glacialis]